MAMHVIGKVGCWIAQEAGMSYHEDVDSNVVLQKFTYYKMWILIMSDCFIIYFRSVEKFCTVIVCCIMNNYIVGIVL